MTQALRTTIEELAARFAEGLVGAIRGMNLDELLALTTAMSRPSHAPPPAATRRVPLPAARPARGSAAPKAKATTAQRKRDPLGRRSPDEMKNHVHSIVQLLKANPGGLRAEQIQAALGLNKRETPRPLGIALKSKVIRKTGERRATMYFAR